MSLKEMLPYADRPTRETIRQWIREHGPDAKVIFSAMLRPAYKERLRIKLKGTHTVLVE